MPEQVENMPPGICQGRNGGLPSKMGPVWLVQPGPGGRPRKTRVRLSVYNSNFDRYAVVSQEKLICKDCGYINLKNATIREVETNSSCLNRLNTQPEGVKTGQCSFQIVPKHCDGNVLTFLVSSKAELSDWLKAMDNSTQESSLGLKDSLSPRKPLSPRSPRPAMPILEEEGNEE